jgi:hypothetical protein
VLSHKLDRLEEILLSGGALNRSGGARRQLWLEVWLLAFFACFMQLLPNIQEKLTYRKNLLQQFYHHQRIVQHN